MRFKDGELYTVSQIAGYSFGNSGALQALPSGTLFRYSRSPGSSCGYFDEVVEPENALVSSEEAQKAVEHMREHGMTFRQIARLTGISIEAVYRSSNGVGRIRASTEAALLEVAGRVNGGRRKGSSQRA